MTTEPKCLPWCKRRRAQLVKAEAERDEARATKDMHKERQEEAWAEVTALRAENEKLRAQNGHLQDTIDAHVGTNSMCQIGHERIQFAQGDTPPDVLACPMCNLRAEVEELCRTRAYEREEAERILNAEIERADAIRAELARAKAEIAGRAREDVESPRQRTGGDSQAAGRPGCVGSGVYSTAKGANQWLISTVMATPGGKRD